MFKLPVMVFLLGLISLMVSASQSPIDYRLIPKPRTVLKNAGCTAPGLSCRSCSEVQSCLSLGDGNFSSSIVQTCGDGSWCLKGECVNKNITQNPLCQPEYDQFYCPRPGLYPHPVDCRSYYICCGDGSGNGQSGGSGGASPGGSEGLGGSGGSAGANQDSPKPLTCDTGYGYNARTTFCDKKLNNNQCPIAFPVPICKKAGDSGPVTDNPSIFYVCTDVGTPGALILYPKLNVCKNGRVYKGNGVCL